jgi:putative membrane protein
MRNRGILIAALMLTGMLAAIAAWAQPSAQVPQGTQEPMTAQPPEATPGAPPPEVTPGAQPPQGSPSNPGAPKGPAMSGPGAGGEVAAPDKSFLQAAAHGNLAEVELGRLAADKATSADVKAFAQKMVDDHGKANDRLKQVASSVNVVLPSGLTSHDKSEKARLEKLSGADFDREYVKLMVKDHEKDVAEFAKEAKREMAPGGVKNFAAATLPTLQDHLKMAQELSGKVATGAAGAAGRQ